MRQRSRRLDVSSMPTASGGGNIDDAFATSSVCEVASLFRRPRITCRAAERSFIPPLDQSCRGNCLSSGVLEVGKCRQALCKRLPTAERWAGGVACGCTV
jgi:hypothetical protein